MNDILLWTLRFAYPLTTLLIRRWLIAWPLFGLYLVAVSVASWLYNPWLLKWTLITDAPAMLLKTAATIEVLYRIFEHEPEKHRWVVFWILMFAGLAGVSITLGIEYRSDNWDWIAYKTVRAALNVGLFMAMLTGFAYGRFYGAICPVHVWRHAAIWTAYIALYASFAVIVPATEEGWLKPLAMFRTGSLMCLIAWLWAGLRIPRYSRSS